MGDQDNQPRIQSGSTRRFLQGTNLLLYTLVALGIVVLANWWVSQHDRHWDLTPNKRYSLSPQTLKQLKGLHQNVAIDVFDQEQRFRTEKDLLDLYSSASPRVTVRYVDPDRDPQLAKQYAVRSYGTVVVASGDRHYEASGANEEGISNALIRLLQGQRTIYFVEGHGEQNLDGTDRTGYSSAKKAIESENSQVKTLELLQKPEIPGDCSLLVIAGPHHDYLPPEIDAIRKYVAGGGRALFMLDPGVDLPNLTALLAEWNVKVRNDLVIDQNPMAQFFGTRPEMPLIVKYGTSPIVEPLARTATLFPLTRSFDVNKADGSVVSLCETTPESFGVEDFDPNMHQISYRPDKDLKGPLTVAVSDTIGGEGAGKTEGRIVVMGTSLLAANSFLGFQGNRDLFMNMIDWLSANENLISIRPKPPEAQHLNLTAQQMNGVLIRLAAVPLIVILAGILVWWTRR